MGIKVKKIREDVRLPERASNGAIGYDVFASIVLDKVTKESSGELPITIPPEGSVLIGIGVKFAIPWLWQCEVRPRSGLACRDDIELSNSPGTIDPDFRGEAGVLLRNRNKHKEFTVEKNMRIAQLIFSEVKVPVLEESDGELPKTARGEGGFGSTGLFDIKEGTADFHKQIAEIDRVFMKITQDVADYSKCVRGVKKDSQGKYIRDENGNWVNQIRKFGCLIVKNGNIIAMGYNAQRKGSFLCSEVGCLRDEENIPSGTRIEKCRAVHAEMWAFANLMVTGGASSRDATMYLNAEPCEICATMVTQSGIETVVLLKGIYPRNGTQILRDAGINIRYVEL